MRTMPFIAIAIIAAIASTLCEKEANADASGEALQRILATPYVSAEPDAPVEGFLAYGGDWAVEDGVARATGAPGPRLDFVDPAWRDATDGVVEVQLRFPKKTSGFSGVCFKISDSAVGADEYTILVPAICKVTAEVPTDAEEPAPAVIPDLTPAHAEGGATYTVKEGDTIRSIAKEFYGTIHKWRLIYEANFDSMVGTDMIYVGQMLQIP